MMDRRARHARFDPVRRRAACSPRPSRNTGAIRTACPRRSRVVGRFAANVLPIIREAQKAGTRSLRAIADVLNARGVRTARGGKWAATQVRDILRRADSAKA